MLGAHDRENSWLREAGRGGKGPRYLSSQEVTLLVTQLSSTRLYLIKLLAMPIAPQVGD